MPRRRKPALPPIERFPTVPRRDGRFEKRIHGRLHYFGRDGDRELALAQYERVKHALYEGRQPASAPSSDMTVKELAYRILGEKDADANAGRITHGWNRHFRHALGRFNAFIGAHKLVADLRPDDFSAYGRHLRNKIGLWAYNRERSCIMAMFAHASDADWLEHPVKVGRGFPKIGAAELRASRRDMLVPRGIVQACVRESTGQLRAMILLAALGGYGAMDCAQLEWRHVDWRNSLIRFSRPKTNIERVTPLPPETVQALQIVHRQRPQDTLVFRTVNGNPWVRSTRTSNSDSVGPAWMKLQRALEIPTPHPFYDLRHTFATHAHEVPDIHAVRRIMGHKLGGMSDTYVEAVPIEKLRAVVSHVRSVLLSCEVVHA